MAATKEMTASQEVMKHRRRAVADTLDTLESLDLADCVAIRRMMDEYLANR